MTHRADRPTSPLDERSGKMFESSTPVDRWPMVKVVFERFALDCAQAMRHLTSTPTYFAIQDIKTIPLGTVLDDWSDTILTGVHTVPEWDQMVLVGLEKPFIYAFLEVLLGAPSVNTALTGMELTPLSLRVAGVMFEQVCASLKVAFAECAHIHMKHERIETRLDLLGVGRRNQPMMMVDIGFQALGAGGHFYIVIPQAALLPLKSALTRREPESVVTDHGWSQNIEREIQRTRVSVQAVIERPNMTLGEIGRLDVGTILLLPSTTNLRVKLLSNEQALFWCELGKIDGGYTVKIEEKIDEETEFMNGLIG